MAGLVGVEALTARELAGEEEGSGRGMLAARNML